MAGTSNETAGRVPRRSGRSRGWTGLAFALLVGGAGCGGTKDGGDLRWERDPAKAFELAHFVGKPMALYFTSDG